jgi:hypothetical protein
MHTTNDTSESTRKTPARRYFFFVASLNCQLRATRNDRTPTPPRHLMDSDSAFDVVASTAHQPLAYLHSLSRFDHAQVYRQVMALKLEGPTLVQLFRVSETSCRRLLLRLGRSGVGAEDRTSGKETVFVRRGASMR